MTGSEAFLSFPVERSERFGLRVFYLQASLHCPLLLTFELRLVDSDVEVSRAKRVDEQSLLSYFSTM